MRTGRTVCVDSWAASRFRIEPTDLHTECRQKRGGSTEVRTMATQQVSTSSTPAQTVSTFTAPVSYARPLAIVTTLFFMWGFLTSLNDILVPHLRAIFDLSYAKVMLIQF